MKNLGKKRMIIRCLMVEQTPDFYLFKVQTSSFVEHIPIFVVVHVSFIDFMYYSARSLCCVFPNISSDLVGTDKPICIETLPTHRMDMR